MTHSPQDSGIGLDHTSDQGFHHLDLIEVIDRLATEPDGGLPAEEANRRLEQVGPNRLDEAPPKSIWAMLWEQFNNFLVWLLVVAAFVSAVLGDWAEAMAILLIVSLNAGLGILQERRVEQALTALRRLAAPEALVLRDGRRNVIPAWQLVPGDIILLQAGNYVPADVRLLEAVNLRVEEAALTGESVPVQKDAGSRLEEDIPLGDRKNTAFMGTLVAYGRGRGVVVSTGMRTQIGLIAEMLQAVGQEITPLQRRLDQLGHTLGYAALAICGLVFALGWLRGQAVLEMFLIAVSLAIAAVPEGLPAVVTIALALGMRNMIRRNALIRRLSSVETLGSATVICSDKTGTLTQNEMTVTKMWVDGSYIEVTGAGYTPAGTFNIDGEPVDLGVYPAAVTALWAAALNNNATLEASGMSEEGPTYRMVGDPTEGALLVAAVKLDALYEQHLQNTCARVKEIPFDSARKRMVTVHTLNAAGREDCLPFAGVAEGHYLVIVKGAPDLIVDLCSHYQQMDNLAVRLDERSRGRILRANDQMTAGALRVIAVAYRTMQELPQEVTPELVERDLVFIGLLGMIDPPRPEVHHALQRARLAGIETVMITGDYPNTARAIATATGLLRPGQQMLTGNDLNAMDDEMLQREVANTAVFARVSPQHKVRIVEALRERGEVVAMTGDGINDAPALKRADIGVAMGIAGTDVAKETADMVLTDDNYASIVAAVEQGRVIYGNIRKFVYYLLSCNLAEIAIIFLATLAGLPSPLKAIQLLWLNLVTDGAPALALGVEKGDPDVMDVPPRPPGEPIINKPMRIGIITQTISLTLITLVAYFVGLSRHPENVAVAKTMAFVTLSTGELPLAYIVRSERFPLLRIGPFSNRVMNWAVLSSAILLLAVVYLPFLQPIFHTVPLGWEQWMLVFPLVFLPALGGEIVKWLTAGRLGDARSPVRVEQTNG